MKNRIENLIMICGLIAMICVGYVFGMNSICKNAYCDDFDYEADEMYEEYAELMAEDDEFRNSFSNSNSETEISEQDLTKEEECVIVNEEVEIAEPTDEDIIKEELGLAVIDEITMIDSYEDGNWYCYYLYSDGDVYVVTIKNDHIDMAVQLN